MNCDQRSAPILLARSKLSLQVAEADSLTGAGFSVIEVVSTDEVLSYLESGRQVRMVITDIDMPGCLSGPDLARFIHRRWPQIKIIIVGWPRHPVPRLPETVIFIQEPCSPSAVLQQVRTAFAAVAQTP